MRMPFSSPMIDESFSTTRSQPVTLISTSSSSFAASATTMAVTILVRLAGARGSPERDPKIILPQEPSRRATDSAPSTGGAFEVLVCQVFSSWLQVRHGIGVVAGFLAQSPTHSDVVTLARIACWSGGDSLSPPVNFTNVTPRTRPRATTVAIVRIHAKRRKRRLADATRLERQTVKQM